MSHPLVTLVCTPSYNVPSVETAAARGAEETSAKISLRRTASRSLAPKLKSPPSIGSARKAVAAMSDGDTAIFHPKLPG